jgi:thiaminase
MGLCEILSAKAPCHCIYLEITGKLSKSDHRRNNKIYKKWAQFNSSDKSRGQLNELKKILCVLADEVANYKAKLSLKKYFCSACQYEFLFWDMTYQKRVDK